MSNRKLSAKQQNFVRDIITGMGPSEAYRNNYKTAKNWGNQSVASEANKLLNMPHIAKEMRRLKDEADTTAIASREDRLRFLTEVMNTEENELRDRIKAVEVMNRMSGDNIQTTNANISIDKNPLHDLSVEQLEALVDKL